MKKFSICLAMLSMLSTTAFAEDNLWVYNSTDKTLTWKDSTNFVNVVSNVTAKGTSLSIGNNIDNPLSVTLDFSVPVADGYEITEFGGIFQNNLSVTTLIMPPKVKELRYDRFRWCYNLKYLKLNDGLEKMGDQVFNGCPIEGELYLPSTLKEIGSGCFNSKGIVGKVVWPEKCSTFKGIAGTSIHTFIGLGIKSMGNNCLARSPNLTNVVLSACLETTAGGDWFDYSYVNCDVYWKSFPSKGMTKNPMTGHLYSNTITNHLAWHQRDIWRDFAATNTFEKCTMTVPEKFDGYGVWGSQVTVWWVDPDHIQPSVIIIK